MKQNYLVMETDSKTEIEKKEKDVTFGVVLRGESPNGVVSGTLSLKTDDEGEFDEFDPDSPKKYRVKLEEVKE